MSANEGWLIVECRELARCGRAACQHASFVAMHAYSRAHCAFWYPRCPSGLLLHSWHWGLSRLLSIKLSKPSYYIDWDGLGFTFRLSDMRSVYQKTKTFFKQMQFIWIVTDAAITCPLMTCSTFSLKACISLIFLAPQDARPWSKRTTNTGISLHRDKASLLASNTPLTWLFPAF